MPDSVSMQNCLYACNN